MAKKRVEPATTAHQCSLFYCGSHFVWHHTLLFLLNSVDNRLAASSDTPALHSPVLDFTVFNHLFVFSMFASVVIIRLVLDAPGPISHSQANANGRFLVLFVFYIFRGGDRCVQASERLWRGTSGTLIRHLLWHQALSSLMMLESHI